MGDKKLSARVQEYIIDRLDDNSDSALKRKLQSVVDEFQKYLKANKKDYVTAYYFKQFLLSVPKSISIDDNYEHMRKSLSSWYGKPIDEPEKYDDEIICDVYCCHIYCEFIKLCHIQGISFVY